MARFVYTKDSGDVSDRDAIPIGFIFDDRDKVMCIDMAEVSDKERRVLEDIRREFLNTLYQNGFKIKTFFLDGITNVRE